MAIKRKTRMYEPWGYREENNYQGREIICENDLDSFFADTEYVKDDNKIYFYNKDGEKVGTLNVEEFVKSDSIVEKTEYKDGILKIYFTNGDIITIDLTELLDENEFKDGLIVADHVVKVLVDANSERWLTVSPDGVKVSGIQAEIDRLDERIDDEIARAISAETALDEKIEKEIQDRKDDVDEEEARAKAAEQVLTTNLNNEITRATQTEQSINHRVDTLNDELDAEESRAEAAEQEIRTLLTREINDRIADVNEEETRAKAAEQALQNAINAEEARAISAETALDAKIDQEIADREADVDAEETRATSAEADLQAAIDAEAARATSAETELQGSIAEEGRRAQDAEADLQAAITAEEARATSAETALQTAIDGADGKIDQEIADRKAEAVASAEYELSGTTPVINFYNANDEIIDTIDATEFITDGMVDNVKIENDNLVITFNVDSGKETIEIPLTEIFDPSNYYTKADVDAIVDDIDEDIEGLDDKIDNAVSSLTTAITAEETRATGAESDLQDAIDLKANAADVYTKGEIDGKESALQGGINANADAILAERDRAISAETDLEVAVSGKADANTVYTQEEVDALIAEKEAEITQIKKDYNNLKEIVGEIGGNVEWGVPADGTFNNMMKKSGIVKLGEDTTTSTYAGGVTSKNKTTLHLNGKNLTFSGATKTNPAIMTRGKQELTIIGKGTFDADGRTAIEAASVDTVINLSGTTGLFAAEPTYVTDKMEGELIYCYLGTINIYAGVFKNNGADKTFLLNCYDANYSAGTAKIVVYGGKFYDFDPSNAMSEPGAPISYLADGYHVETSTDGESTVYTVKKDS